VAEAGSCRVARPRRLSGRLAAHLLGVAGEERDAIPGVVSSLPSRTPVCGEVTGRPVPAECWRVRPDGAHGFYECSAFSLSRGHCSTLERLHPSTATNHAVAVRSL